MPPATPCQGHANVGTLRVGDADDQRKVRPLRPFCIHRPDTMCTRRSSHLVWVCNMSCVQHEPSEASARMDAELKAKITKVKLYLLTLGLLSHCCLILSPFTHSRRRMPAWTRL